MKITPPDFRSLFESAPGLYLIILPDKNFTIVAVSDAYANATMTKREEIIGKGLFEVFPDNPDDPQADGVSNLRTSLGSALKNKLAHTMAVQKYDIRKPDGTFEARYWSPLNKPVLNKKNEIEYIIHRVEDVSDFIRLQKEHAQKEKVTEGLREQVKEMEIEIFKRAQEIQLRNALDKMLEGVQIIGFDWRYIYVNDAMAKHGKYLKEELIGSTVMEKYPGIEKTDIYKIYLRCFNERVPIHLINEFRFPDNSIGWFELSFQPVPEGILILSVDITERKKAEQEILDLNQELESKVIERTAQLKRANEELEIKNKSITDSINYARRIQQAMLPEKHELRELFPHSFILHKPKDIVSGDFYWLEQFGSKTFVAVADCTGHGVPGALMSMIGFNLLNEIIKEGILRPSEILNRLNMGVRRILKQNQKEDHTGDGMDIGLFSIDADTGTLEFSGANRPLFLFKEGALNIVKGDKHGIGGLQVGAVRTYTNHKLTLDDGDLLYACSDGYIDQFGGDRGKKLMRKRFIELLNKAADISMHEQEEFFDNRLMQWKGNQEQTDDVLLVGLKMQN